MHSLTFTDFIERISINLYPTSLFGHVNVFCFSMSAASIQVYFRLDFIMEANSMNPDQTLRLGAV